MIVKHSLVLLKAGKYFHGVQQPNFVLFDVLLQTEQLVTPLPVLDIYELAFKVVQGAVAVLVLDYQKISGIYQNSKNVQECDRETPDLVKLVRKILLNWNSRG